MDWLKELLKNAGIEESKIDGIVTEFNKEVPKHLIPKDKFNELTNTKNQLEKDILARDKQLEELKTTAGTVEDLKTQIQEAQNKNKADKEQYEADLKKLTMTNAIKLALAGKVHDEDLASGLIDKEKLVIDGENIIGLDEQIKALQESKAFLFKQEEGAGGKPTFMTGQHGNGGATITKEDFSKMSYLDRVKFKKENPTAYEEFVGN